MRKFDFFVLLVLILVKAAEPKLFDDDSDRILRDLINYNSAKNKQSHEKIYDFYPETVYYHSPYSALARENASESLKKLSESAEEKLMRKRSTDTTFRGKPKTIQVSFFDRITAGASKH
jgi:hypothetical protein